LRICPHKLFFHKFCVFFPHLGAQKVTEMRKKREIPADLVRKQIYTLAPLIFLKKKLKIGGASV